MQIAAEALYVGKDMPLKPEERYKIDSQHLEHGNGRTSKFTETQANDFVQNWEIVSHITNTGTGFSGTLFKAVHAIDDTDIQAGDLVISFRSTEFIDDAVRDNRATNTFEIKNRGWAFGQIADVPIFQAA